MYQEPHATCSRLSRQQLRAATATASTRITALTAATLASTTVATAPATPTETAATTANAATTNAATVLRAAAALPLILQTPHAFINCGIQCLFRQWASATAPQHHQQGKYWRTTAASSLASAALPEPAFPYINSCIC